jgi:phospholipid/cholesterol/gamma-HCH transport system ATP-binding protein
MFSRSSFPHFRLLRKLSSGNLSAPAPAPPVDSAVLLEALIEDVHKAFGRNQVLRGINLSIARGEMLAIVGASGGGKSVLLKHLIGVLRPDKGRVMMADHESAGSPLVDLADLNESAMDRLRRHWAVVFQKNALFTGTVYDNVALGLSDVKGMNDEQIRDRIRQVLESVGLGFEEVSSMDRDEVSGGMAKRVAIARALALDPVLMLYDEPTSGLDPARAEQIQDLIRDVHHRASDVGVQRTTVIVTHDTGLLSRLRPRILMLHEGYVYFDGTTEAFAQTDSPVIPPTWN